MILKRICNCDFIGCDDLDADNQTYKFMQDWYYVLTPMRTVKFKN